MEKNRENFYRFSLLYGVKSKFNENFKNNICDFENEDYINIYNKAKEVIYGNKEKNNRSSLISIFSDFDKEKYYMENTKLDLGNISQDKNIDSKKNIIIEFEKELNESINNTQIYFLIQKYFWCIPSLYDKEAVSLFDEISIISAVAMEIYDNKDNELILLKGDISGIQEFIFDVTSKRAGKSLKGRSAYINLLSLIASKYFLDKLNLKETNLIYNGGGNFYILTSLRKISKIEKFKREFLETLLKKHNGNIYLSIETENIKRFDNISDSWKNLNNKIQKKSNEKWKELLKDNFDEIFNIKGSKSTTENKICDVCKESSEVEIKSDESGNRICDKCKKYINIAEDIMNSSYLTLKKSENNSKNIFNDFGYEVTFNKGNKTESYLLNKTEFLKEDYIGFLFYPNIMPEDKDFETIAKLSEGIEKLAVLKLDVDNLGKIFEAEARSLGEIMNLSRMFKLFFEGYINTLLENYKESIYTIFSGGDDTFIVGAYDKIMEFANEFREKFRDFTCNNTKYSFSASIVLIDPKQSVVNFAEVAEDMLDKAKNFSDDKDKIVIMEEVFSWEEYKFILYLQEKIKILVIKTKNRAILDKMMKSTKGFDRILKERGKMQRELKTWRFSYYLRNIVKDNREEVEEIIKFYETFVFKTKISKESFEINDKIFEKYFKGSNIMNGIEIRNPMALPIAVRIADFKTREKRGE